MRLAVAAVIAGNRRLDEAWPSGFRQRIAIVARVCDDEHRRRVRGRFGRLAETPRDRFANHGAHAAGPKVGEAAPDFSLPDQNGQTHKLSDYRGKWLVLYFYVKDDTPGCTEQACKYRDDIHQLSELGAQVVGVHSRPEALARPREAPGTIGVLVGDIKRPSLLIFTVREELGPGLDVLPPIALTAFEREDDRRRALDAMHQAHLSTPFSAGRLVSLIGRITAAPSPGASSRTA